MDEVTIGKGPKMKQPKAKGRGRGKGKCATQPPPSMKKYGKGRMKPFVEEVAAIAKVSPKEVENVIDSVRQVLTKELCKKGAFKLAKLVSFKVRHKPAKPAGSKHMFGKDVPIPAKAERKILKTLRNSRWGR